MEEDEYYLPVGGLSPSTGEVSLFFEAAPGRDGIAGVRVEAIAPGDARIYYEDDSGISTTATQTNADGFAIAFGLSAPSLIFRATRDSGSACVPRYGGFEAPGMPGAFQVPVLIGRETRLDMRCP